ncbi:MAG TPA: hypothetical protein VJN39_11615 [Gemmatimonadales bacterium]|nr:hypothetical protein [Gemmatimonadales bacterium]
MRTTLLIIAAASFVGGSAARAQRPFRIGPTVSSLSLEDGSGNGHGFTSWGGSIALITSDEGESGVTVARYSDLALNSCARSLTLYALDSYYYPVGTRGVAPFASAEFGLARVVDSDRLLLGLCGSTQPTSQWALGFGLGLRINAGDNIGALIEGRFFQVPNSAIQALEARANLSVALGQPRKGAFLQGTLGPAVSAFIPISGPMRSRAPFAGVRFRRDTKKAGAVGLEIDFAPLEVTTVGCAPGCEPNAILFAPGYEASARPPWGRVYAVAGPLLAGVYTPGSDRGILSGAHGGVGADLYRGGIMWNLNGRLLWLQRNTGENVFGVQVGVSLSPRVGALR